MKPDAGGWLKTIDYDVIKKVSDTTLLRGLFPVTVLFEFVPRDGGSVGSD